MSIRVRRGFVSGFAAALAAALLVGCISVPGSGPAVVGQGPVVTEDRQVEPFTSVEIRNGIKLVLSIGATTSVQVSAQQNLVPLVSTAVSSGKLTAQTTQSVVASGPITVTVVTPSVTALTMSDGAFADVSGIATQSFALDASNGASVGIVGSTETLTINASDGTFLRLGDFAARDVQLTASDGVTGTVNASGSITGSASDGVLLSIAGGGAVNVSTSNGAIVTTI